MPKGEDITTRFKVDISDLKKNITEANKQIKLANAEFKAASAGMDDWTKSSAGLTAKLKQLESVLESEKNKLKSYREQLEAINKAEQENGKRADELKAKLQQLASQGVSKTSEEYKKYEKALNEVEKEQEANRNAADNLRVTILNQQGAVNKTEKEIRNYSSTLDNLEDETEQAGDATEELSDELENADNAARNSTGGFTVMKGALASLVADGFRLAINAAKDFAKEMITTAAAVKAETSMFEQTFGDMGDEATAAIGRVADATGILETRLNVAGAKIYAFAMSNGATATEAMTLMETALMASADSAAYYDKSLDETTETMMSFLKGNYANDAALGVSATEFTRNAKATELFGQKFNDLTEIQKQQTLLAMVTDSQALSGAMGQASRETDGWENVMGNLKETWRQFQAQVGTPVLEALIPIVQQLTEKFTEWRNSVDWEAFAERVKSAMDVVIGVFSWFMDNGDVVIAAIAGIIAAFAAAKIIAFVQVLTTAIAAIKAAAAAQGIWNAVMMANPIGLIVTAIGLLVAGIVLLIKNWDKVKEAAIKCWESIKEAWGALADWFNTTVIEPIKNFFSSMWDGIKNVVSGVVDWIKENWQAMVLFLSNPIAGLFKYFYDNFEGFRNFVDKFVQSIKDFFSNLWEGIKNVFVGAGEWFNTNVIEPIKNFFQPLLDWFTKLFTSIKDFITSVFKVIGQLAEGCVKAIQAVWGVVAEWFNTKIIQPITQFFTNLWEVIKTGAKTAWDFIVSIWTTVTEWFDTNIIQPITKFFTDLWNGVKTAASDAWNGVKETWNTSSTWFSENVTTPVSNFFADMWTKLKDGGKNAWEGIKETFSKTASFFEDTFKKAWKKVKDVFSTGGRIFDGIKDGIVSAFKTMVNAIINGINKVVAVPFNAINRALDKIRSVSIAGLKPFGNLDSVSVPQIPLLAKGGVLKKGQMGLLEGSGAEAVVPLEKNREWIKKVTDELHKQLDISSILNTLKASVETLKSDLKSLNVNVQTANASSGNRSIVLNQYNTSPKALSRLEIYRQTKNAVSLLNRG